MGDIRCNNPRMSPPGILAGLLLLSLLVAAPSGAGFDIANRIAPPDGADGDLFGFSAALSGDLLAVGAYRDDDMGTNAGSVYIYAWDGTDWTLEAKITPADGEAGDWFGRAVALEGDTLAVGAPLYDDDSPATGRRGVDVGAVYIYLRDPSGWSLQAVLLADGATDQAQFGWSVALQGDRVVAGAVDDYSSGGLKGGAWVFLRNGSTWAQEAHMAPPAEILPHSFGFAVSIDGDTIVVGDPHAGKGCFNPGGAASVFVRENVGWVLQQNLIPHDSVHSSEQFGQAVPIQGDTLVVGAPFHGEAGAAYVYSRQGATWSFQSHLVPFGARESASFGHSVAFEGDQVVAGAITDNGRLLLSGAAYHFLRTPPPDSRWKQIERFFPDDGESSDYFGLPVSLSEGRLAVGAAGKHVAGVQSGVVYVFEGNRPPECDAGPDIRAECDGVVPQSFASDPDGDPLTFLWTSSCPGTGYDPWEGFLRPTLWFGAHCGVDCDLTFEATDPLGASCEDEVRVEVEDVTAPEITLPPDALRECDESTDPSSTGFAAAEDNCLGAVPVSWTDSVRPGNCQGNYTVVRTWSAEDSCDNTSSEDQEIEVRDTTAPVLDLPPDLTLECGDPTDPSNTGSATAIDNCEGTVPTTYADTVQAGNCTGNYVIVRSWSATDSCGNTASADQIITVRDTLAPVLTLPPDTTLECDQPTDPSATGTATAEDRCEGPLPTTFDDEVAPGNCAGNYVITRTWSAVDSCGNASSDDQIITVQDTTPPIILEDRGDKQCIWPPNHRFALFDGRDFSPVITDNCSPPLVWRFHDCASDQPDDGIGDGHTSGDCLVAGGGAGILARAERSGPEPEGRRYLVDITATDDCGNTSAPAPIGAVYVPHDQGPAVRGCRRPTR